MKTSWNCLTFSKIYNRLEFNELKGLRYVIYTERSGSIRETGRTRVSGSLRAHGVEMVFGVPGESYLAVLDGLQDANSIQTIICRQEGGATMMAEAYGKMTGKPGVCLVTRGPGATNASAGVHIAMQDLRHLFYS